MKATKCNSCKYTKMNVWEFLDKNSDLCLVGMFLLSLIIIGFMF